MTEKKKIQVVGAGCKKCKKLFENTEEAVKQLNKTEEYEVEYITEIEKFSDLDVFITPALRVNGKVVSEGKLLSIERIKEFF